MKKIIFSAWVLIVVFAFNACQKEVAKSELPTNPIDQVTANKVSSWIDNQTAFATSSDSKGKIQNLKSFLMLSKLKYEELNNDEKLIIVPMNNYLSVNNKNKKPINCLLLIETKEGKIRKGNIVQYVPTKKSSIVEIPKNTFTKYYNSKKLDDALFTFLSITDQLLYETEYRDGAIHKFSTLAQNNKPIGNRNAGDGCIDWYWQTFENGVLISEQYIFTTCGGTVVEEGSGGGEGGGGWPGGDEEVAVTKTVNWTVTSNPENGIGEIKSTETIKGRRRPSTAVGGYFTSINHNSSICNFCSSSEPYNVWWETNNICFAFAQVAYSSVTGNLNYNGYQYPGLSNNQYWTFSQVFP